MDQKQKIVVIGAGPVGSLAALYAANRGHAVEIYELRSGRLPLVFSVAVISPYNWLVALALFPSNEFCILPPGFASLPLALSNQQVLTAFRLPLLIPVRDSETRAIG